LAGAAVVAVVVEGGPAVVLGDGLVVGGVFGGVVVVGLQLSPGTVMPRMGAMQLGCLAAEEKEADPASRRRAVDMSAMTTFRTLCIVDDISPPVLVLPAPVMRDWRGTQQ
jgi:hypothetical protein